MSSNMLKNWQETACTVTNTAEKKRIHLFGRIYEKIIQTRKRDNFTTGIWKSSIYFLLIAKMQQIQKLRIVNNF